MKPVMMQHAGTAKNGDCLMACVASILECELADLPPITEVDDDRWYPILADAFRERGFFVVPITGDEPGAVDPNGQPVPQLCPGGYTIAVGPTDRVDGEEPENHAVVAFDGAVVHDPHPSHAGIVRVDYWLVPVPILRGPRVTHPARDDIDAAAVL